jgi:hypothetical protein
MENERCSRVREHAALFERSNERTVRSASAASPFCSFLQARVRGVLRHVRFEGSRLAMRCV